MPTSSPAPTKRETLNIRIKPEEWSLIDRAAKAKGKNRTDFILDAARAAAEEALLDRTFITANLEAYAEFLARLDMPPQPNERLRKTMRTPAPWDEA
ncbi:type II toxin-antitoxin system TacA family antitoxin [Azotobacter armeniacus]